MHQRISVVDNKFIFMSHISGLLHLEQSYVVNQNPYILKYILFSKLDILLIGGKHLSDIPNLTAKQILIGSIEAERLLN